MVGITRKPRRRVHHESLDGFLFNVEKFFGSVSCQRMSFTEKGVYLVMLFQEWRAGSVPDDAAATADLVAVTEKQVAEVLAAWPVVRRKFIVSTVDPGTIVNAALEDTRRKQRRYLRVRAEAGRLGGEARARKLRQDNNLISVAEPRSSQAQLQQNVGRGSDQRGSDQKRVEKKDLKGGRTVSAEARQARSTPPAAGPSLFAFPTIGPITEWPLSEAQVAEWAALYPGLDIIAEARQALAWVKASGTHRKTARGMPQFLVNWFNRSVSRGGNRRHGSNLVSDKTAQNIAGDEEALRLIAEGAFGHERRR